MPDNWSSRGESMAPAQTTTSPRARISSAAPQAARGDRGVVPPGRQSHAGGYPTSSMPWQSASAERYTCGPSPLYRA
jgi:hypothetical protein